MEQVETSIEVLNATALYQKYLSTGGKEELWPRFFLVKTNERELWIAEHAVETFIERGNFIIRRISV